MTGKDLCNSTRTVPINHSKSNITISEKLAYIQAWCFQGHIIMGKKVAILKVRLKIWLHYRSQLKRQSDGHSAMEDNMRLKTIKDVKYQYCTLVKKFQWIFNNNNNDNITCSE